MASIANDPQGRKRVIVLCPGGERHAIRLGKVDRRSAEAFRLRVEKLVGAIRTDSPLDDDTADWLVKMDDALHARLAEIGLCSARAAGRSQLKRFTDKLIDGMTSAKPRTLTNMRRAQSLLVAHFGESRDMRTVNHGEAEDWRTWLVKEKKLGDNTVRRLIGRARQIWNRLIKRNSLRSPNPFDGLPATVRSDKSRQFFVTESVANAVIEKCNSPEWKLIFALSRYGGLRCPSEHLALRWSDVNWENNRVRVPECKTAERFIPIFPELRPHLLAAFEAADEGDEFVINRYRSTEGNLRTQLHRFIRAAGVTPWPKVFHNLRASRETELAAKHPIHVVCYWIGNSRAVAQEHYLMVKDEDFEQAARQPARAAHAQDCPPVPVTEECHTLATRDNALQSKAYPRQGENYPANRSKSRGFENLTGAPAGASVARRAESIRRPSVRRGVLKVRAALSSALRRPRGAGKGKA